MRRLLTGFIVAVVGVVVLAAPASAHAQLVDTAPTAGAVLDQAPTVATVTFNENVQVRADGLQLHDASGKRVDNGGVQKTNGGRTLRLPLGGLNSGGYVLTWRVVSADGHPVSGGVTWRIGKASTAVDQTMLQQLLNAEGGDPWVGEVAAVARTLLFGALVVLVGGLVFLAAVWPDSGGDDRLRRTLWLAAVVAAVATVAGMGLEGADVAGLGLGRALNPQTYRDILDSTYGHAAVARLALLAVLAALAAGATSARVRAIGWRLAAGGASVATLLTLTLSGHARTGRWVALAIPLDLIHLVAVSTWIGGLAVLTLVVLRRDDDGVSPVVARFSSVAAVAVGTIVATGVVQGYRQLGHLGGLRDTGYGRLLVLKVVAVAVVVVLGALSRSLVRDRVEERVLVGTGGETIDGDDNEYVADPAEMRRALRRSVGAEAVVAVVVLALTSLLVSSDPTRTLQKQSFVATKVVHGTVIEAVAAPDRTGPVDIHVYVTDTSVGLTTPLAASATLSLPSRGITGITVPLVPAGRSHWSAYNFDIPIRGTWILAVTIAIGQFDERQTTFQVAIN